MGEGEGALPDPVRLKNEVNVPALLPKKLLDLHAPSLQPLRAGHRLD